MSESWPEGVARIVLASTPSTNADGLRMAPTLAGSAWILTYEQTQGRGRRGRGWTMPAGNFAGTLVTRPKGGLQVAAQLSFVAALALYEAFDAVCGDKVRLAIKWPNDVLINGGKVAGILLESAGTGAESPVVAVGMGINLAEAPAPEVLEARAVAPVSVFGESGVRISPDDFLDLLAPRFAHWQHQLETFGFGPIRNAWLARAARLGEVIVARTTQSETQGVFEGIDETGALILVTSEGRRAIPAADVYFQGEA